MARLGILMAVALIARPSHAGQSINVESVHTCRDSLQRLSTLAQLKGQTLEGLSSAVASHSATCDAVTNSIWATSAIT